MIEITFNRTDEELTKNLRGKYPKLVASLIMNLDALDAMLQGHIQSKHLSGPTGPTTLSARTGHGRNSVRILAAHQEGSSIIGGVTAGGGTEWYMRLHEEGVDHSWVIRPTNKKALAFMIGSNKVVVNKVVHPPLPSRPFMRTSQIEKAPEFGQRLNAAASKVISE